MHLCQFLLRGGVKGEDTTFSAVPAVRNRGNSVMEELITVFQDSEHLDQTTRKDLPLVSEGDLDLCDKTHTNRDRLLGYNSALRLHWGEHSFAVLAGSVDRLHIVLAPQLDDLILEDGVTNFVACDLPKTIDRSHLRVLNVEVDLDVASISLLHRCHSLRSTNDLQGVPHVRRYQKIVRVNLQEREYFNSDHVRHDRALHSILLTDRVLERKGEGSELVDAGFVALGVELSVLAWHLRRLKASSSPQAHRLCLDVEVH